MDFTRQSARAVQQHSTLLASGERTCIDCHKGIAHKLPALPLPERQVGEAPRASVQPAR
jgi:nitrate/TMAO reductase-like tetraheme cytochrome c subunit